MFQNKIYSILFLFISTFFFSTHLFSIEPALNLDLSDSSQVESKVEKKKTKNTYYTL